MCSNPLLTKRRREQLGEAVRSVGIRVICKDPTPAYIIKSVFLVSHPLPPSEHQKPLSNDMKRLFKNFGKNFGKSKNPTITFCSPEPATSTSTIIPSTAYLMPSVSASSTASLKVNQTTGVTVSVQLSPSYCRSYLIIRRSDRP